MASPSELSLDNCKPHTHSLLLKCFSDQIITPSSTHHQDHQQPPQKQQLEEFLSRLEAERLKIDAFKRELPLCMQLLTNAMESSRQQLQEYRGTQHQQTTTVVLEEFIPLKNSALPPSESASVEINTENKANWMTTAQLWSQETKPQLPAALSPLPPPKDQTMMGFNVSPKFALEEATKQRDCGGGERGGGGGGAFLPFSKERLNSPCPAPTLALTAAIGSSAEINDTHQGKSDTYNDSVNHHGFSCTNKRGGGNRSSSDGPAESNGNGGNNNGGSQGQRKARRCWSPDLHRRFVNALQMLGGSQVATPKQIRELMKVDGLTNDEVKSHLQKYRLHTRRPSPSPQAPGGPGPQLVVLGGIWVPPEYAAAAHGGYGATAHGPPPHFCAAPNSVPQDYYVAAGGMPIHAAIHPPPQHHHAATAALQHHHQVHVYKTTSSQANSSGPESDDRAAGRERSESIEDGKSDSSSWKAGESGDNAAVAAAGRGLAALRENGEECNRSEITLKF
ncbi:unnamed protein product [Linum tenue]|uniref:HTH myb-type domain-containing protein n=1 Tax=Linum tenue TaxID=586396 RepID=A0AAV0HZ99_9ROSI|nr:unnamed protein product [Linum tenue]